MSSLRVVLVATVLGACAHERHVRDAAPFAVSLPTPGMGPLDPPGWDIPAAAKESERNRCIDRALAERMSNRVGGDARMAPEDEPLGVTKGVGDRYEYVMRHRPDIAIECSRAPRDPAR